MTIALVTPNGTSSVTGTGPSISLTRPAGASSGHVMWALIGSKGGNQTLVTPTGATPFSLVASGDVGSSTKGRLFVRVLGAEAGPYTWNITTLGGSPSSRKYSVVSGVFSGEDNTNPNEPATVRNNGFGANTVATGITPGILGYTHVLYAAVINRGMTAAAPYMTTMPSGFTKIIELRSGTAGNTDVTVVLGEQAISTALGDQTGTWAQSEQSIGFLVGLVLGGAQALSGTVAGVGTFTGALVAGRPLAGNVVAVSTATANLTALRPLIATAAATSTMTANLTNVFAPMLATVAATSTTTAALTVAFGSVGQALVATIAAESAITANLTIDPALAATVAAESTITADLSVEGRTLGRVRGRTSARPSGLSRGGVRSD